VSAAGELVIDVLAGPEALDRLAEDWRALVARCPAATVFQTQEWSRSWWTAIGAHRTDMEPRLLRLSEGGRTVGILPLMLVNVSRRRVFRFLSAPTADYHDLLLLPEVPAAVLDRVLPRLLDRLVEADGVELDELRSGSVLRAAFLRAGALLPLAHEPSSICPYVDLKQPPLEAQAQQSQYRRKARLLAARLGEASTVHLTALADIEPCLSSFFQMHAAQWCFRSDVAGSFTEVENVRFFQQLARQLAPRGWLLFSRLTTPDLVLAQDFSFRYGQRLFTYRAALAREAARYSPGHLLLQGLLRWARERDLDEVDLLRGEYPYKYLYATGERRNLRLRSPQSPVALAREDGIVALSSLRSSS
jgi:CelD/BcsL family acetyltransferase involved in cellulose biosynthesis